MSRSMIRRRQEAERERLAAYDATLRRGRRAPRPAPDIDRALAEAISGFDSDIVRPGDAWRPKLKTRDAAKLRLAAARHLFARFQVAAPLEAIWLDDGGLTSDEVRLRKHWYIVAARGGSLFKEGAGEWLSRKEVHRFLNPPGQLSFDEAFWQAVARSYTDDVGVALRIARSRIASKPRAELGFWREVVQFFCTNGAGREAIDDLCDFLAWKRGRDRRFSVKGRTLGSLGRMMRDWHRDLGAIARIEAARRRAEAAARPWVQATEGGRWPGSPLADWSWQPASKEAKGRREEYAVRQLVTAEALVEETRAMHHCVSTYAHKCIAGHASIWSMVRRVAGREQRLLTIEMDRNHRAVQVRGLANRLATDDEAEVLARWAKARGVLLAM
jgi:hypothetical protein